MRDISEGVNTSSVYKTLEKRWVIRFFRSCGYERVLEIPFV